MLSKINKVNVSKDIIRRTFEFLQIHGNKYHEAHAIWIGRDNVDVFDVVDVWFPKQQNTLTSYEVPAEEVHRLNVLLSRESMTIISQIHSHPSTAFHSDTDDEYSSLSLPGSFSIVVPDFGFIDNIENVDQWTVFRYTGSRWIPVSKLKVKRIFNLT